MQHEKCRKVAKCLHSLNRDSKPLLSEQPDILSFYTFMSLLMCAKMIDAYLKSAYRGFVYVFVFDIVRSKE